MHYDSPDRRGIDVALLYMESVFRKISSSVKVPEYKGERLRTRYILQVCLEDNMGQNINMIVKHSLISFDFNDVRSFLRYYSDTKFIEFFTLSGNIDYLDEELSDLLKHFPTKYHTLDDISNLIVAIHYNRDTDEDIVCKFLDMIVSDDIMNKLTKDTQTKWTMIHDPDMEKNIFRIDIFTKCN